MAELDPLELTTRQEKIVSVAVALGSILIHVVLIFGSYIEFWPEREEKKQLMIIRRIPDLSPAPAPFPPEAMRKVYSRSEAVIDQARKPEQSKPKPETPREQKPTEEPPESVEPKPPEPEAAKKPNSISIYTDLNEAFFRIEGPASFKGGGTFWERKDIPPGEYKVTFGTVEGYQTPPPQSGSLAAGGALSFVGRYTKMTQVIVNINIDISKFKIIRPDGKYLDLKGNRQGLFKDLPEGVYTISFEDVPGFITPGPQNQELRRGGSLSFTGFYAPYGTGSGRGTGEGKEQQRREVRMAKAPAQERGPVLDRRVRVVVNSYPSTSVDGAIIPVAYPESAIRKASYQEGWCQVYLILRVDGSGEVTEVSVERPRSEERERFAPLIAAAEQAARAWKYDQKEAEVHLDVRFYVER